MDLNVQHYLSVIPRIYRAHQKQTIRIQPKHTFLTLEGKYTVHVLPRYRFESNDRFCHFSSIEVEARNNALTFDYAFGAEQEYLLRAVPVENTARVRHTLVTSIYALDADLYGLCVAKGDLHMHTTHSDGLENVEHRIVQARKNGHDFLAVTDHNAYYGSLRAITILRKVPSNMVALHGEEIHADFCPVHILSLGAREGIAPQVVNRSLENKQLLHQIMDEYRDLLPEDVDLRAFASAQDVFRRIRQAGGMSVLCHIYWDAIVPEQGTRQGVAEQLVDALVAHREFDAFEITSGAPGNDTKANYLQEIYYREHLPENFPLIGITDSHTTDETLGSIFGKNYTIVFAKEFSEEGIMDALRSTRAVSVDAVSGNGVCHGSLRLCKFATFLRSFYFPIHDAVVRSEGDCMERIDAGQMQYLPILQTLCQDNLQALEAEWQPILPRKPLPH